jgi:hypothetical protein
MGKVTLTDYDPSDPIYSEGPQRYSPHWARTLIEPKKPAPPKTAEPPSNPGLRNRPTTWKTSIKALTNLLHCGDDFVFSL